MSVAEIEARELQLEAPSGLWHEAWQRLRRNPGAIVGFAWLTGGDLSVAVIVAIAFFLLATAWSWWRFRQRIADHAAGASRRSE